MTTEPEPGASTPTPRSGDEPSEPAELTELADLRDQVARLQEQVARLEGQEPRRSRELTRTLAVSVGLSAGLMGLILSLGLPWIGSGDSALTGWGLLGTAASALYVPVLIIFTWLALVFVFAFIAYRSEYAVRFRTARIGAFLLPFLMMLLWPWGAGEGIGAGALTAVCACAVIALTSGRAATTVD